ncbi:hypothetical protein K8R33_01125 [archaeon]|nr:hypothetical protein [archaeon]
MLLDLEKAQIMRKLARKGNWKASYDRLEHFKRFQSLDKSIKELSKIGWIIIHKKDRYTAISLNPEHKKKIIEYIEKKIPHLKGIIE